MGPANISSSNFNDFLARIVLNLILETFFSYFPSSSSLKLGLGSVQKIIQARKIYTFQGSFPYGIHGH